MKYIIFQCKHEGKPTLLLPVMFPDVMTHKDVAEMVEHVKVEPDGPFARWWMWPKPVSAGFVNANGCQGYSESLKLKAHPDDTVICMDFDKHHGRGFPERGEKSDG